MGRNSVEMYCEPIEILDRLRGNSEMSRKDLGFLCGLIKKYKPKKIVEIGVAGGHNSSYSKLHFPFEIGYSSFFCGFR